MRRRRSDRKEEQGIARRRIARLEVLAEEAVAAGRLDRAARYALLARRLSMRLQVPYPRALSRRVCKACGAFLVPGRSARVRLRPGRVAMTCLACGEVKRIPHRARRPAA